MAYEFSNEYTAKAKITDDHYNDYTLTGINGREASADSIMGGLSYMLDIVGWSVVDAKRIITQDIEETY